MNGLMQPGPTLYEAAERRKKKGSQGFLGAVGEPMSFAPGITGLLGNALLGARYLTGEAAPEEGAEALAMMTGLLQGTKVAPIMRNVISKELARTLNTKRQMPEGETFGAAVANTPGASITDEGLSMRLTRNQIPDQARQESVRGGVFYLPEGAAQAKHYSTGRHGYGGSEKITGETIIANPMFVKGATGGKAPQAAYDSIAGKGAYEAMRKDALNVVWSRPALKADTSVVVDEFLDKYAPEMSGMGEYIVRNSTKGNQLAYALQEAAVSSAVRKAGHDAVLGYSVARSTKKPFISEVFDVRERTYPDKFGSPADVWDDFLNGGLLGK